MLRRIGALCREKQVDVLCITDPFSLRYISGFRGGEGMLLVSEDAQMLITDSRYTEAAEKETDFPVREENRKTSRMEWMRTFLEEHGMQRIGYEDRSLICCQLTRMQQAMPEACVWIPIGDGAERLRRIKTPAEVDLIRKAEHIGDLAFSDILNILKPGMTELEVAAELEYSMKKHGAGGLSFDTIAASGPNSSMPHAMPGERKLQPGDFLTMDFGCTYMGYCSDMTRTVVIGHASPEQKKIYDTVLRAQEASLAVLRPGLTGAEGDRAARSVIEEAGYGAYFGHGVGHSVGLFIHEEPRLSPSCHDVLEAGMLETVEPGIYVPGTGGVRIEDLVVLTENGCENLTASPKQLIEL